MDQPYGKLVVIQQGGPEQVFELGKATVNLGRATTNDIVLNDAQVSRFHARLDCGPSGCTVIDLGSSNGTRVNGIKVDKAIITPEDVINLGTTQLRYQVAAMIDEPGMTVINSEFDLDMTIDREILPMSLAETTAPRLIVHTSEKTWEVPLDEYDSLGIGRSEGNPLVLDLPKVSRRHAEVIRKGDAFILRDLESTNGTWYRHEKVDERVLQDGDAFRVGPAELVFKTGFIAEALTMADTSLNRRAERNPVVFVPGSMGSELWLGNERVWPNVKHLFKNPEIFSFPFKVPLEPRSIVNEVVIVPNLIKQDQYNRLSDYLVEELGYERDKNYFEFPYDWRQDVRISARQLGQMIETLPVSQPVIIIAHSLGTMVSRYYLECLGGDKHVERIMLMGGPHQGALKILTSMLVAPNVLPFGIMGEKLRQVVATFPASYQIIPPYACGVDQNGVEINFLEDETWVAEENIASLRGGREFRKELSKRPNVTAISIFGYGLKTITRITLNRNQTGKITNLEYQIEPNGDGTILEKSAVFRGTEIHPVQQYHGSLFADNDVKMRLKLELTRQF